MLKEMKKRMNIRREEAETATQQQQTRDGSAQLQTHHACGFHSLYSIFPKPNFCVGLVITGIPDRGDGAFKFQEIPSEKDGKWPFFQETLRGTGEGFQRQVSGR